jgi:DnaK suppressor protein
MTIQQLEFFRKVIKEQMVLIVSDPKIRNKVCESPNKSAEDMEQASTEFDTSMYLELRTRSYNQLHELKYSLGRIKDGTYGICLECEDDIPVERLMVKPTACFCIDCQEENERQERRRLM